MIKGMALLAMGFAFVACSHDTNMYDENFANKERVAEYNEAFTQAFGSIASGHQWGFDQTTGFSMTRTALTSSVAMWKIPENLEEGRKNMQGWNANEMNGVVAEKFKAANHKILVGDGIYNNYWLQHVDKPQGYDKHTIEALEAYNSTRDAWEVVTNFEKGQNTADFKIESSNTIAGLNRSVEVATLMVDMGGKPYNNVNDADDPANGSLFRVLMTDNDGNSVYNYDYALFSAMCHHKKPKKKDMLDEFLGFRFTNDNTNSKTTYWIIRLAKAEEDTEEILAEGRVFCEDMGANDFDFNDVVFDAWILKSGDIRVRVLAHGGILPIFVDGEKVTLEQMTNTGVNDDEPYEFTIKAVNNKPKYTAIKDIPITVTPNGTTDNSENSYDLTAPIGSAPQKVCAPVGTSWPDEYVPISRSYTQFPDWVTSLNPKIWSLHVVPELVDGLMSNNN